MAQLTAIQPDYLNQLKELHAAATPGPWHLVPAENMVVAGENPDFEKGTGGEEIGIDYYGPARTKAGKANKALLTEARNALPVLLETVEAQQAQLRHLWGFLAEQAPELAEQAKKSWEKAQAAEAGRPA